MEQSRPPGSPPLLTAPDPCDLRRWKADRHLGLRTRRGGDRLHRVDVHAGRAGRDRRGRGAAPRLLGQSVVAGIRLGEGRDVARKRGSRGRRRPLLHHRRFPDDDERGWIRNLGLVLVDDRLTFVLTDCEVGGAVCEDIDIVRMMFAREWIFRSADPSYPYSARGVRLTCGSARRVEALAQFGGSDPGVRPGQIGRRPRSTCRCGQHSAAVRLRRTHHALRPAGGSQARE